MTSVKSTTKFNLFIIIFSLLVSGSGFSKEYFKGFDSGSKTPVYSIGALLKYKYKDGSKWNENYFHEAQFPAQGIMIFTNVIFSGAFMGKKGCKLSCIITFPNGGRYSFNKDYGPGELVLKDDRFCIMLGNEGYIELADDHNYKLTFKDPANNVAMNLTYKIVNPPQIFGDGIVPIDGKNFLSYSQPICGAYVSGSLEYNNKTIKLNGRGSVDHDFNSAMPIMQPRKLRSFWFYNDRYSINIHTVILTNKDQVDRVSIFKNGILYKSFLNTGLNASGYVFDNASKFSYPEVYSINHSDSKGDSISARISVAGITDRIQVFKELSPMIHAIVVRAVGEMWAYRFWVNGDFSLNVDNQKESIKINGSGNYVDVVKEE